MSTSVWAIVTTCRQSYEVFSKMLKRRALSVGVGSWRDRHRAKVLGR